MSKIEITSTGVKYTPNAGVPITVPTKDFFQAIEGNATSSMIYPSGVKFITQKKNAIFVVHETTPRIWNFKWLKENSPEPYGAGAKYRNVKLALPYVYLITEMVQTASGVSISQRNACYFCNEPIKDFNQKVAYPARS